MLDATNYAGRLDAVPEHHRCNPGSSILWMAATATTGTVRIEAADLDHELTEAIGSLVDWSLIATMPGRDGGRVITLTDYGRQAWHQRHRREQAARQRITLTRKRRITEALEAADEYRTAGMLEQARLLDQLADSLEAQL